MNRNVLLKLINIDDYLETFKAQKHKNIKKFCCESCNKKIKFCEDFSESKEHLVFCNDCKKYLNFAKDSYKYNVIYDICHECNSLLDRESVLGSIHYFEHRICKECLIDMPEKVLTYAIKTNQINRCHGCQKTVFSHETYFTNEKTFCLECYQKQPKEKSIAEELFVTLGLGR